MTIKRPRKHQIGDTVHFFLNEGISMGRIIGFKRDLIYVEIENEENGGPARIKIDQITKKDRYE